METDQTEGIVERAVAFVKNVLSPAPRVEDDLPFGPPEPGVIASDPSYARPTSLADKSAAELNDESARREDGAE